MTQPPTSYHHGDLRAACLNAALELLEEDGSAGLSLRAVARRAGVSPMAPYRHYPNRDALVSAVAAEGYRDLARTLAAAHPAPATPDDLAEIAIAYVRFALDHPAMFRVMFAEPCDPADTGRAAAVAAITAYVQDLVTSVFPDTDPQPLADAVWAFVHGLAFLHLDGKFDATDPDTVAARVRATLRALLDARAA
ncbi:TetR/AcrR family transcriptional regulator [Spirillospora sp. CA-253888]